MSAYIAVDIDCCIKLGHRMEMFGSDKTPMKRSLECLTCSSALGKTAIVAYGDDTKSFGAWRPSPRRHEEPTLDEVIE